MSLLAAGAATIGTGLLSASALPVGGTVDAAGVSESALTGIMFG